MATIAYRILKFKSMIKRPIMTNHTFFAIVTFSQDQFLRLYQFYSYTAFIISNLQKDFHQDNLPFVCSQFYKHNYLNILAGNICFQIQVKNQ